MKKYLRDKPKNRAFEFGSLRKATTGFDREDFGGPREETITIVR